MERLSDKRIIVAAHEVNHCFVGKATGAIVHKETVIPEGKTAGYVMLSFSHLSLRERLEGMMAACVAGYVAEERIGHSDHSGCGSDLVQLDRLAQKAAICLGNGCLSAEYFKQQAFQKARSLTPSLDILISHAEHLAKVGTIV